MKLVKRKYQLGEEWLYFKIYCGIITADSILANEINELTQELLSKNLIIKWFFIRYADPEKHIRVRFELTDKTKLFEVINAFNTKLKPLLEKELVWKIQTETYNRELERYGPSSMELSETLFFKQSQLIIQLLQEKLDEKTYFVRVLKLVDKFISNFNLTANLKIRFLEINKINYSNEFELDKWSKLDLNSKFQKLQKSIAIEFIEEDSIKNLALLNEIKEINILISKEKLEIPLVDFIATHIHMFVNRAFRDRQRFFELIIYDFLFKKYYSSFKNLEKRK